MLDNFAKPYSLSLAILIRGHRAKLQHRGMTEMTDWSAKNPYTSNLTQNFVLNGEGSRRKLDT